MQLLNIQEEIFTKKYKDKNDKTVQDMWRRVDKWVSSVENPVFVKENKDFFYSILEDFVFIPGGRISEAAGTSSPYANNCFALDIEDDIEDIYETVKRTAVISKKNGGVGINFSKIRPKDFPLSGGGVASGVVSFMKIFNTSCEVIKTGSKNRRAALIGLLFCDHPEIFDFIDAKREKDQLNNFNISVAVTSAFMMAVINDDDWDLKYNGKVHRTIKARELWDKLCYSGWMYNDPGIFFVDTVNAANNLYYIDTFKVCNPCGELPLFPWGACCLGNVNTTKFVTEPFKQGGPIRFDLDGYRKAIRKAVRFLDNIIDVSKYPYQKNYEIARRDRRIGLNGLAGIGSTLAMLCMPYDSEEAREFVSNLARICRDEAYRASVDIAKEKGSFPSFDKEKYLEGNFIKSLPKDIQMDIEEYGIRNCALLTCPPVGTGSMLAGNISSGIEPIFALEYERQVLQEDGSKKTELMEDYAWREFKKLNYPDYEKDKPWIAPEFFKTSMQIDPKDHIKMQAAIQLYTDGSISKTANLPEEYTLDDYKDLLLFAWDQGLKGFTTFRSGTREGVLSVKKEEKIEDPKVNTIATGSIDSVKTSLKRPRKLKGETYQIPDTNGENTYCTINAHNGKPWEIFFSANGSNYEWFAAIGRLASRVMRKTNDVQSVIDELKQIKGNGFISPEYGYVESKPALVAHMLEEFTNSLKSDNNTGYVEIDDPCPECGSKLMRQGGCKSCSCGYSACG